VAEQSERNVEIVRRGFGAFETMDMDVYTGHERAREAAT
jgi:hypothetical protein